VTRKQAAFLLAANAVISTVITLLLVLVVLPALGRPGVDPSPTADATATQLAQIVDPAGQPAPTAMPVLHVVQAGDTISGLALEYDVPEEDIIAANDLQNPNFLQLGTELVIPVGGLAPATPTLTPVPTATETPIPFEPPSADMTATAAADAGATATVLPTPLPSSGEIQVEIADIVGAGQADEEQVVITNTGERLADMQGWTLSDGEGNAFTFPNFRLWTGGSVTVHTRIGQDGNPPSNFYWNKLVAIWSLGEEAVLRDADGAIVSRYVVRP
jgi:LysM repeat protein